MTCIIGIKHKGVVYIAADSAGSNGIGMQVRADTKVFRNKDYVIGFTSSYRMGQLLRYSLLPPKYREDEGTLEKFMATKFIDAVRQCLKDGGYASTRNSVENGGTFLVGINGELFMIYDDYQVAQMSCEFASCGCGEDIALGALTAMREQKITPEEKINIALNAAHEWSAGVRPPFVIISTAEVMEASK